MAGLETLVRTAAVAYDFDKMRWACMRPHPMRWSQMLLGRRKAQAELLKYGTVTVSAYLTADGRTFFTDPVTTCHKAGPGVLYRVTVKLKPAALKQLRRERRATHQHA